MIMKYPLKITGFVLLMAFGTIGLFAQDKPLTPKIPVDSATKKIMYRDVVSQEGTPAYLYDRAVEWFGFYFLNAQSVFSVQDKVNGKVEGIGRLRITYKDEKSDVTRDGGMVTYQIRLEFKENKYRYTLTDFNLKTASRFPLERWLNKNDPAYNREWDNYLIQVDTTMHSLITSLKEKMKPKVVKKDEW
jgi:hypothetical protein